MAAHGLTEDDVKGIPVEWHKGFPFNSEVGSPQEGMNTLKAFVTVQETGFRAIEQRAVLRSDANPLARLLAAGTRGAKRGTVISTLVDDWATVELPFVIHRA